MSEQYRKWDYRFLELAKIYASWSKDPSTKVGAVIVHPKTHIIRGMGYNGFPRGVADFPDRYNDRETKYKYVVHAEVNACINSNSDLRDCTIYVYPTLCMPAICPECAKVIIQYGIKRVVYYNNPNPQNRWQELAAISKSMFLEAGVKMNALEE